MRPKAASSIAPLTASAFVRLRRLELKRTAGGTQQCYFEQRTRTARARWLKKIFGKSATRRTEPANVSAVRRRVKPDVSEPLLSQR